jgi:hypothetical protein
MIAENAFSLWTCEVVSFAANEVNPYDYRHLHVPNTTHLTPGMHAKTTRVWTRPDGWPQRTGSHTRASHCMTSGSRASETRIALDAERLTAHEARETALTADVAHPFENSHLPVS